MNKSAIVISASSDIALEVCKDWCNKGWNIYGTYRNLSEKAEILMKQPNVDFVPCDLLDPCSIEAACNRLIEMCPKWDVLLFATSRQEPVGDFHLVDFDIWEEGLQVNLIRQLRVLRKLLPYKNADSQLPEPTVLFFAGGGTNNAVVHYSCYTLSKIALIKMVELLDAELPDVRFAIIGPGWVKTKSHLPTLLLGAKWAGENYQKTIDKLEGNDCTQMQDIIDCLNWIIHTKSPGVKGRNFSVVNDLIGSEVLEKSLENDLDMYKLRRNKNNWAVHTAER